MNTLPYLLSPGQAGKTCLSPFYTLSPDWVWLFGVFLILSFKISFFNPMFPYKNVQSRRWQGTTWFGLVSILTPKPTMYESMLKLCLHERNVDTNLWWKITGVHEESTTIKYYLSQGSQECLRIDFAYFFFFFFLIGTLKQQKHP